MPNSLNFILKLSLGVNMSKYLYFTNEIILPVHRNTNENDMKKTEAFHNFSSSVFIGNHLFLKATNFSPGTGGKKIGREDQVQGRVRNVNVHKSKGPNADSGIM